MQKDSLNFVNINGFRELLVLQKEHEYIVQIEREHLQGICPDCGQKTNSIHATEKIKVQHLPLHGKQVQLIVTKHQFKCKNNNCGIVFNENFQDLFERNQALKLK